MKINLENFIECPEIRINNLSSEIFSCDDQEQRNFASCLIKWEENFEMITSIIETEIKSLYKRGLFVEKGDKLIVCHYWYDSIDHKNWKTDSGYSPSELKIKISVNDICFMKDPIYDHLPEKKISSTCDIQVLGVSMYN